MTNAIRVALMTSVKDGWKSKSMERRTMSLSQIFEKEGGVLRQYKKAGDYLRRLPVKFKMSLVVSASAINPFDRSYNEIQHRFDAVIISMLSTMGRFVINITHTPLITNLASYETNPNSWVAEQLVNGTCNISSSTMVLTPEMPHSIFYSFGVSYFRPQLYYKVRSVREEYNIYYIPFSTNVWISLFGLLVVITVTLTFILGRETKLPHDTPYDIIARIADEKHDHGVEWNEASKISPKDSVRQRERWEIGEILLIAIGVLSQQGSARDPSTSAARTLLLVMFLLALLSFTAYSASVISFVSLLPTTEKEQTSVTKSVPINKQVAIQDTNYFRHCFQITSKTVNYVDIERGIDDAIAGKVLFIGDRDMSLTHIHKRGFAAEDKCNLARVFMGYQYQRVFALQKNSSLKESVNTNLASLREFGILSRERSRFFDLRCPCGNKERSSVSAFVSFNIDDIKPALELWGCGIILSIILLLLEFPISSSSRIFRRFCFSRLLKRHKHLYKLVSKIAGRKKTFKECTSEHMKKLKENDFNFKFKEAKKINYLPYLP